MNGRDFGCAKSLELAELCEVTAAIVESSLRSCPRIRRSDAACSKGRDPEKHAQALAEKTLTGDLSLSATLSARRLTFWCSALSLQQRATA
jgi:hypothetical protein